MVHRVIMSFDEEIPLLSIERECDCDTCVTLQTIVAKHIQELEESLSDITFGGTTNGGNSQ